ncbi:hypothetical protein B4N89_10835 [Embleya scabrispora]|uniref:Uncharacterized protein n=2 Tax=Embleya scabrispora TaxID=159449 RepID=A0A1T3NX06_9ACTN|nr:hypothetical protein B4N89_10835 [Embleya scabrispora]
MALIAGVVFTGIAIAYLLRAGGHALISPEWSLATAAIGVGLAGLAGALWSMLPPGRSEAAPTPPAGFFTPAASEPGGTAFGGREGHEDHVGTLGVGTLGPKPAAGFESDIEAGTGIEAAAETETENMAVVEAPAEPDSPAGSSAAPAAASDGGPDDTPPAVDLTK